MNPGTASIEWAGEQLVLLPERAVWWPKGKTLFIADPHFGKASTFRFAGIPVPETSHDDDLEKLERIIKHHGAERLVVLGDFFHAKTGRSEATLLALSEWRARHGDLKITLVIGNHDVHAGKPPEEWGIECVEEFWALPPFACCHKPTQRSGQFILAGHLHPAFRLSEGNGPDMTGVCFYFSERLAVLPAFGNFTGKGIIRPQMGERVFIVADDNIIDVSKLI